MADPIPAFTAEAAFGAPAPGSRGLAASNKRRLARMLLGASALTAMAVPNAARADCGAPICYTIYPVTAAQDVIDKLALANGGSPTGILVQPLADGSYPTIAVPGTQTLTGHFAIDAYPKAGTLNEGSDGSVDFVDGLVDNGNLFIIGATRTIASDISGSGDLELTNFANLKALAGTLTLSGTNSYSGGTFVYGAGPSPDPLAQHYADFKTVDLLFQNPQSLPASGVVNVGNNGTVGFGWAFDQSMLGRVNVSPPPSNISQTILLGGIDLGADNANPLDFTDKGSLFLGATGGDWTYSGALTPGDYGHSVTAAGYSESNPLVPMYRLGDGNGTLTVSSDLTGAAGVVIHDGYTILSGTDSYTGGTNLESIGVLQFASRDALGAAGTNPIDLDAKAVVTIPGVAQDLLDHLTPDAAGTVGLMADNASNLDFTSLPDVSLGVINASRSAAPPTVVYSGTVTPGGNTYRFGGGLGTMTLTQALHDGTPATNSLVVNPGGAVSRVILPQVETYSGTTSVGGGVLQLGNQSERGELKNTSAISTVAGSTLAFAEPDALTLALDVQGDGNLEQDGPGTLTITTGQSYAGKTAIAGGTLVLAPGGSIANSSLVDLTHGGASLFDTSLGAASPAPVLDISAAGDQTMRRLTGDASAVVKLGADTLKLVGPVSTTDSGVPADTFAGVIGGSGGLEVDSGVDLQLTGVNTYTGVTTVGGAQGGRPPGMLTLGNLGNAPISTSSFVNDGLLGFEAVSDKVITTPISGSGNVYFDGPITLIGNQNYTGRTFIGSSLLGSSYHATTLQLGNGMESGMIGSGPIGMDTGSNPTLVFNEPVATTLANDFLSGLGTLVQKGPGDLTLTGNGAGYLTTTVEAGSRLFVDGTFGSQFVAINPGGTLGGGGMAGYLVSVADGGTLLGVQGKTLTMGVLALSSGSDIDVSLGAPGNTTGLFKVNGTSSLGTTLDGTLNVSDAGGFGPGLYRLIDYTGLLTDNGLDIGATPDGYASSDMAVQTSVSDQVNLVVSQGTGPTPSGPYVFWDGADTTANGAVDGGSGTWSAAATNWTNTAADANGTYDPSALLIFTGTAGTATVDAGGAGSLPLGAGLQFANDGFKVEGDGLTLTKASTTFRVGDGTQAGAGYIATIASNLTGAGGLDKTDLGTLILTGANSYAGGTTISGGTLQLGNGGATGSIAGNVTDDGVLAFDHSGDMTFGGVIGGSGSIRQIGVGKTGLTGDSGGFAGTTTVQDGTLGVDGRLGGALDVLAGGRLQGVGTVGNTVVSGTVAPGNSIGTLNVAGTITFNAGSIYEAEVDAAGQADKIAASGTATIGGGKVSVLAGSGNYAPATTYTILTANGGRTGTFAGGVTSNLAFLDPSLTYDANDVYLTMTRNGTGFQNVGITPNQIAAGDGVESLGTGNPIYDAVLNLSAPQAQDAFDRVSGEIHASLKAVLIDDGQLLRDQIDNRIRSAFGAVGAEATPVLAYGEEGATSGASGAIGAAVAPATADRLALWASGFGAWGHIDSDGNAARIESTTGGVLLGADAPIGEDWRLGLVGGYSRTTFDVDDRSSSGNAENWHLGLYGGGQWGALGFRAGAAYTWHDVSTGRTVAFPGFADSLKGDYDAGMAQVFGELGYGFKAGNAGLEPFANLAYVNLHTDGFTEDGGAAALHGDSSNKDVTFTTIGLHGSTNFTLGSVAATARGTLGWRHAFGDVTPLSTLAFAGGDAFAIAGTPLARDAFVLDAGLDFAIAKNATLGISYGGQFSGDVIDQSVKGSLAVKF